MKIHILFASAFLLGSALFAQEYRGTFSGTVTDAMGAAVPKAKVIATEIHTGTKTTVFTETSGAYTIPFLPPGEYNMSAEVAVPKAKVIATEIHTGTKTTVFTETSRA